MVVFCGPPALNLSPRPFGVRPTSTKCPELVFVNKMDRAGADFLRVVQQIEDRLGSTPVVLQFAIGAEEDFQGHIDLMKMKAIYWEWR